MTFICRYGALQMLAPGLEASLALCPGREVPATCGELFRKILCSRSVNYCELMTSQAPHSSGFKAQVMNCYLLMA